MPSAATTASTQSATTTVRRQPLFVAGVLCCTGTTGNDCHSAAGNGGGATTACVCRTGLDTWDSLSASAPSDVVGSGTGAPHCVQNLRSAASRFPHFVQKFMVFSHRIQTRHHRPRRSSRAPFRKTAQSSGPIVSDSVDGLARRGVTPDVACSSLTNKLDATVSSAPLQCVVRVDRP
jgi:hypothetical protein